MQSKGVDNGLACPNCGEARDPIDLGTQRPCWRCLSPYGKIAELALNVALYDKYASEFPTEAKKYYRKLYDQKWPTIRDLGLKIFHPWTHEVDFFALIRDRFTDSLEEWNEFLDRPLEDLIPILEMEIGKIEKIAKDSSTCSVYEPKQFVPPISERTENACEPIEKGFITQDSPDAVDYMYQGNWCDSKFAFERFGLTDKQLYKARNNGIFGITVSWRKVKPESGRSFIVHNRSDLKQLSDAYEDFKHGGD